MHRNPPCQRCKNASQLRWSVQSLSCRERNERTPESITDHDDTNWRVLSCCKQDNTNWRNGVHWHGASLKASEHALGPPKWSSRRIPSDGISGQNRVIEERPTTCSLS